MGDDCLKSAVNFRPLMVKPTKRHAPADEWPAEFELFLNLLQSKRDQESCPRNVNKRHVPEFAIRVAELDSFRVTAGFI